MAKCQQCQRKTDLYLCTDCQQDLHDMLQGLAIGQQLPTGQHAAGFIEYLEDAKLGRTRLGESARRSNERTTPLPVRPGPDGDWRGSPSELLDNLHTTLTQWVEVVNVRTETLAVQSER
ncbi:hypothetical protein [Mycobacterium intracellulare]|uniref:hypothetical protein n=1 Tax=Mycobacterium intracellulare TaxID=1767 RepID=UPI001927282D|nr:hypothetical protein [Mycobacterium intracellulare]BCP29590.1 hypothetical protein MINTM026_05600 [Mycobacterium intracellulare]